MIARRERALALALGLVLCLTACGRKGNPLPPLPFSPARVGDASLHRVADRVELRFEIPAANADGTTPSVLDRVEIYAMPTAAGATAPTVLQILDPAHLRGHVEIRHEPAKSAKPDAPPDPRPAPGDHATFVDHLDAQQRGADAPVLHYVLVGIVGRARKGPPSGPYDVPLSQEPAAPQNLAFTYDDAQLTLTWQAGASGERYRVYEAAPEGAATDQAAVSGVLDVTKFAEPVVFDTRRCLTVRGVREIGAVVLEGPAAPVRCETPIDKFPPPVPAGLLTFPGPGDGVVELTWDAVSAKDLAGYVVLRGEGSGEKLLPLTKLMQDLHYTDRGLTRGTTYWYAVVAQDARGNASAPSEKRSATVRVP